MLIYSELYCVFMYIHSLQIDKDLHKYQNISSFSMCSFINWSLHFFGKSYPVLFLFLCYLYFSNLFSHMTLSYTLLHKYVFSGGHPYLTGLSIAGGIFCLGAEGAIIGPLLLCGLFVAINMSSSLMKESPSEANFPSLNRMTLGERITHLNQLKR